MGLHYGVTEVAVARTGMSVRAYVSPYKKAPLRRNGEGNNVRYATVGSRESMVRFSLSI